MFINTGDYVEHIRDDVLRSSYYTFTPLPLMEGSFYSMNDALAESLADVHRILGFLEGMISVIPDTEALADLLLFRESCFSKMIDYPDVDIRRILLEQANTKPNREIQNIKSAYHYAMEKPASKLSYSAIINHALHGDGSKRASDIRNKHLFLSPSTANYQQYNPTAPRNIKTALNDIDKYIESNRADPLIKTAMCHYQFEIIHPYDCYNGIVGRIFPYHILSNTKMKAMRFFAISASLYRHKYEYFDKLGETQKSGNYPIWIDFFIRIIKDAAQSSIAFFQCHDALSRNDEEKILAHRQNRTDHTLDVYRHFRKNIVSSIGHTSEQLQLSFHTISRSVTILQELGILIQVTEGNRNRIFAHPGLMEQLILP